MKIQEEGGHVPLPPAADAHAQHTITATLSALRHIPFTNQALFASADKF